MTTSKLASRLMNDDHRVVECTFDFCPRCSISNFYLASASTCGYILRLDVITARPQRRSAEREGEMEQEEDEEGYSTRLPALHAGAIFKDPQGVRCNQYVAAIQEQAEKGFGQLSRGGSLSKLLFFLLFFFSRKNDEKETLDRVHTHQQITYHLLIFYSIMTRFTDISEKTMRRNNIV
ncbi:unnamed protein product [Trichogramma brassicae]|uniref:Uncharacterized protein n=1 Tax=Trichogramma brassicae TaxID=86971 RepID=A0A6H5ISR8_9HYME|nr:unnamed protein product [Trichogramma brassicae]